MPLDPLFLVIAIPAVLFAGISKGGFGSGAAFASTPILALVLEPGLAVGLMLPLLMLIDVAALRAYWRQWDWRAARVLVLGSLPGMALGALLYARADADVFRLLIGLVALGFVASQLARARGLVPAPVRRMRDGVGYFWGGVTGLTSFVSHAGGPPVAVYLLSLGLGKTGFQATTVLVFWAINLLKVGPYVALGIFTFDSLAASALLAPVALLGAWIGVRAHRLVPERAYFLLAHTLLAVTGAKLVWDALT